MSTARKENYASCGTVVPLSRNAA